MSNLDRNDVPDNRFLTIGGLLLCAIVALVAVGCVSPKEPEQTPGSGSDPMAMESATYIGREACLDCHEQAGDHVQQTLHYRAFELNPRSDVEASVCEACHGPGSLHAEDSFDKTRIIGYTRYWETPVATQNGQCLTCHQGGQRLHWVNSTHDMNNLACSDCHNPMVDYSATGALRKQSIAEVCYDCHSQQRAEFKRRSHMPLPEGKMSCEDCHNPHGSTTQPLLKADTVNEVCYGCHAEKRGPFLWEHAPVRERCTNCHLPHGSNHDKLLVTARPFLCQQCHNQIFHRSTFYNASMTAAADLLPGGGQSARVIGRSCQNCHAQIHGSNHPAGARFQR